MSPLSRRELFDMAARITALAAWPGCAAADDYPSRPIKLVIPYTAGAAGDQIGRPWADRMGSLLGPIYVENIGGAGGAIGSAAVAQSAPDGYSILLGNGSTQVMIPLSSPQPAYDTVRDFRAIYRLISSTLAFAVHPSLPVKDLQELIAFAKAHPGKLSYGTPGVGTGNHLVGEMFRLQSGLAADVVHIPYRGMSPATNDLVSGQISAVIAVVSSQILQLHLAGKLRLIAVTSEQRLSGAPEIPTVAESGMPGLKYAGWFGLFAPRATPDTIVERIAAATRTAMADPHLQESYRSQGLEPDIDSGPDKFQRLVEDELVRLAPIVRSTGLKRD
ncbi:MULTISPECIES: tripartite tricarboxylate transporter substrate binding protein [unclassified Bradyrhizobium]|uniref:Bug family tripartite tricarboxylate transporter substrate binding protein n=1 Tax=unclassified Bradyrhizobium TaxID=2631580 RepID=UPI0015CA4651|nr:MULTISPECIES: tripartite tricarboxylate transporter substrate binding protein [unclassified Bradyrhizobium]MBB4256361.1 tripartite-type tricarboxylate transporter receptor subunit TctC [Bradyrhizobium sp. CIR3A]NYG43612.1 tripartite-type tricarboxylate transporter receptor subunit TctC [Bradyrhizobium sp. IAR9]